MLRKCMTSGPLLSPGLRTAMALLIAILYVAVYVNARRLLPDFIFRDAEKIQTQIGGGITYKGTSFDAVGRFYQAIGDAGTSVFVVAVGVLFIWIVLRQTQRIGALFANLAMMAPCLFFNLFVASKDTLVVVMAIALHAAARRHGAVRTLLLACVLYGGYAVFIRNYFALIAVMALGLYLYRRAQLPFRIMAIMMAIATLALLPAPAYYLLQHPRDAAVDYLVYGSPFGARTSFYNPFTPDSFVHFVGNYLYSLLRLNVPLPFSPDVKGIAMQGFIALMLASAWTRVKAMPTQASMLPGGEALACIVLGHVAVSMLFEPDLGSYARHLSSVSLLAIALWSQRTARRQPPVFACEEDSFGTRRSRSARSTTVNAGFAFRSASRRP